MIRLPEPCHMAISYDGKTPYSIPFEQDCDSLDLEVKRLGGTASKLKLYTEAQLKQAIRDALEDAEQLLISEAANRRADCRFIHEDATLHCALIIGKLKEQP